MKKVTLILAIITLTIFSSGSLSAQDLKAANDAYTAGAASLKNNEYSAAISSFNQAVSILKALSAEDRGTEGDAMLKDVTALIPQVHMAYAKSFVNNKQIDSAVVHIKKASELAAACGANEVVQGAAALLPQIMMASADEDFNNGKFAEAVAEYQKIVDKDPSNGQAFLRMAMAYTKMGKEAEAIAAYEKAAQSGLKEDATAMLSNFYLQKSVDLMKVKEWSGVYTNAKKSNDLVLSPTAAKLMGISAMQMKKNDDAISAIESYLSQEPKAQDKDDMIYTLATLYEAKGNKGKACGYYKQLLGNAKYKASADYKIKTTLKCK